MPPQGYPHFQGSPGHLNRVHGASNTSLNIVGSSLGFYTSSAHITDFGVVTDLAWYINSSVRNRITKDTCIFSIYSVFVGTGKLHIGNGMGLNIYHVGLTFDQYFIYNFYIP